MTGWAFGLPWREECGDVPRGWRKTMPGSITLDGALLYFAPSANLLQLAGAQ